MSRAREFASTIHNVIDESTTAVEDIHKSVAALPLKTLATIKPLEQPLREVQDVQDRSIGAVYGLIRRINDRVEQFTNNVLPQ